MIGCYCKTCNIARDKGRPFSRTRFSVFIQADDQNLLIDAGPDIRQQLLDIGVDWINAIFLTHPHYDHICGLGEFYDIADEFIVYGLSSTLDYVFKIRDMGYVKCRPHPIKIGQELEIFGSSILAFRVKHRLWNNYVPIGFIIQYGNKKIVITGDTCFDMPDDSLSLIQSPHILLTDSLAENIPLHLSDSHMSIKEAILLGEKTQAQRTILYHLSHICLPHNLLNDRVKKLSSRTIVGYDGCNIIDC